MSKLDIRVGKIVDIEPNKKRDKLYNEQIEKIIILKINK